MTTAASFQTVDSLEEFHQRQLSWFRTMAQGGSELAPAAALDYCARNGVTTPAWVMEIATAGYCNALTGVPPKKLGRSSGPIERYRQDINNHARWERDHPSPFQANGTSRMRRNDASERSA